MFVVLSFLFLIGFVSSMNGPIRVMVDPDERVSVFIWTAGGGPLLNSDSGVADDDGIFTTKTFFSLMAPYKLIVVVKGMSDSFEQEVNGSEFDNGMEIDCTLGECFVSASVVVANDFGVDESVVNETNESLVVATGNISEEENESVLMMGKLLALGDGGSFNWFFSIAGVFVFLLIIFIISMFCRDKSKKVVLDNEEKELREVESKVKDTEEKIRRIKEKSQRMAKIREDKLKLVEEERELSELEGGKEQVRSEKWKVKSGGNLPISSANVRSIVEDAKRDSAKFSF